MPAGTDLITWSPRVGATGDDRYNVPADSVIEAGSSSYSDPPTLEEVNAGSGVNQIIAEHNRRCAFYDASSVLCLGSGASGATIGYVSSNTVITAAAFSTWRTNINTVMAVENKAAFSWTSPSPAAQVKIRKDSGAVFDMRKALATDSFLICLSKSDHVSESTMTSGLIRQDNFYPPTTTLAYTQTFIPSGSYMSLLAGQSAAKLAGANWRYTKARTYLFFRIPSSVPSIGDAQLLYRHDGYIFGALADFTVRLYKSNSHLVPLLTSHWGNLDALQDSDLNSNLIAQPDVTWDVDHTALSAGSGATFIFVTDRDENDTSPGTPNSGSNNEYGGLLVNLDYANATPFLKLYTA